MNTITRFPFRTFLFAFLSVTLFAACSHKLRFDASPTVPAATGSVTYKKDKNGNYAVHAKVLHLSPPSSLPQPRDLYVFWVETRRNGVKNLGRINTRTPFLSKKLKATLHAITPYEPRRFFITAENDADISYPGPQLVLETR